ncbi:unnamed protein product [Arabidopsis halleri]
MIHASNLQGIIVFAFVMATLGLQKTVRRLTISVLSDPTFLPSTISNWFCPALGSSGDRLQITTSLCRDGLIPSSESDPRSATDTQTPPELFCLTPKGLSNLSPARPSLKHVHLPQWNGPAEATRLSRTVPRKWVMKFSPTHQCASPRAREESSRSYVGLCGSLSSLKELMEQEGAIKRERAMVYAFTSCDKV